MFIAGVRNNRIYCLNATTGAQIWNYTAGNWVDSSPAVANGYVYFGSIDKNLYCINATTGAQIWYYTTGAAIESSPAIAYGSVFFGSNDNVTYCLNAYDRDTLLVGSYRLLYIFFTSGSRRMRLCRKF